MMRTYIRLKNKLNISGDQFNNMKHLKTFTQLNESINEVASDLMQVAKSLKFPGGSKETSNDVGDSMIRWSKRGGHAGDKMVSKTMEAATRCLYVLNG